MMLHCTVLGEGDTALELSLRVVKAAHSTKRPYRLEQTDDEDEIVSHGVIVTPALVINGNTAFSGELPSVEQIRQKLEKEA